MGLQALRGKPDHQPGGVQVRPAGVGKKKLLKFAEWTFSGGLTCPECRGVEAQTGNPAPCKTAEGCDKPDLLLANVDAWEAYHRVDDQIYAWPVDEKVNHISLRTEAVTAVISLMQPEDPLETFDRVLLIHRLRYPAT